MNSEPETSKGGFMNEAVQSVFVSLSYICVFSYLVGTVVLDVLR